MTEFSLTQFSMWDAFSSSANEKAHAHFESIVRERKVILSCWIRFFNKFLLSFGSDLLNAQDKIVALCARKETSGPGEREKSSNVTECVVLILLHKPPIEDNGDQVNTKHCGIVWDTLGYPVDAVQRQFRSENRREGAHQIKTNLRVVQRAVVAFFYLQTTTLFSYSSISLLKILISCVLIL